MRGRTGITVVCIYILCFFSFIMFKLGDNRDEPEAVVKPVNNDFVIIIDAGHGGSDGGAVASDGTNEAVINLEFAKKV